MLSEVLYLQQGLAVRAPVRASARGLLRHRSPPTRARGSTLGAIGWCSQHAAQCSWENVVLSGISPSQTFMAYGQRAVKGQPFGGFRASGGVPGMGMSSWLLSALGSGIEASRPQV